MAPYDREQRDQEDLFREHSMHSTQTSFAALFEALQNLTELAMKKWYREGESQRWFDMHAFLRTAQLLHAKELRRSAGSKKAAHHLLLNTKQMRSSFLRLPRSSGAVRPPLTAGTHVILPDQRLRVTDPCPLVMITTRKEKDALVELADSPMFAPHAEAPTQLSDAPGMDMHLVSQIAATAETRVEGKEVPRNIAVITHPGTRLHRDYTWKLTTTVDNLAEGQDGR
uniref:Uncharacterized protein n=1 Tax=Lotharella globosa TaxID=91324 RepID=A0A7S3Z6R8_9EUKA